MSRLTSSTIVFIACLINCFKLFSSEPSLTVANFSIHSCYTEETEDCAHQLLTTKADILCLRDLFDVAHVSLLYEKLHQNYPYVYLSPSSNLPFLLIFSKYHISSARFTCFTTIGENQCNLFDGEIIRYNRSSCHLYAAYFDQTVDEKLLADVLQIMEKDCVSLADEKFPFLLCSNFPEPSSLLLSSLVAFPGQTVSQGYDVESVPLVHASEFLFKRATDNINQNKYCLSK